MDHAARGTAALQASDAFSAVTSFTKALIEHPSSPDYFVQRSTALTRLKAPHGPKYDLALEDAEYAVLLGQKRAKREKIQAGQQRRVIALFSLEKYGDAAFVLETMVKWRGKDNKKHQMEGHMWKKKIDDRLSKLTEGDPRKDVTVQEYPETSLPSESALKAKLQGQLKKDGTFNFDGVEDDSFEATVYDRKASVDAGDDDDAVGSRTSIFSNGPNESTDSIPPTNIMVDREAIIHYEEARRPSTTATPSILSKFRHEWYQNSQAVTVTLYAKGVSKEKAEVDIQPDSIYLSFPHPSDPSNSFTFTLDPLFAPIDPNNSECSIMSTKVELTLSKKSPGHKWSALEGSADTDSAITDAGGEAVPTQTTSTQPTAPSYPTSARTGPKDWDKVAADLGKKKKKGKKPKKSAEKTKENDENDDSDKDAGDSDSGVDSDYGGDAVDGFFKKLYAGADDNTKRAMMKSYQESGGTALSTNWDEVGKGRVEPVPPKDD
ncbi:MAG: hypothetical protein Q9227_004718 [Pyrenula ochraceoflavens]